MISSEVQRTLVKSPPELWTELSDPVALSRHLGELGEISITRTEPETTVEWTAENTSGTVSIKPSGWGTRVTLSVTRELPASEEAGAQPPQDATESSVEQEPPADAPTADEPLAESSPATESPAVNSPAEEMATDEPLAEPSTPSELTAMATGSPKAEKEPEPDTTSAEAGGPDPTPDQKPARGFFARLFGRRGSKRSQTAKDTERPASEVDRNEPAPAESLAVAETEMIDAAEPEVVVNATSQRSTQDGEEIEPEPSQRPAEDSRAQEEPITPSEQPEPAAETLSEPASDLSAELQQAEEVAAEEVTAVLTAALDRLGAAHHRPFSRA